MKKTIYSILLGSCLSLAICGCTSVDPDYGEDIEDFSDVAAREASEKNAQGFTTARPNNNINKNNDQSAESSSEASDDTTSGTITETIDYNSDYKAEIQEEVSNAISSASSIQDEMDKVKKIADKYSSYVSIAGTQEQKNMAAGWTCTVWDEEITKLWSRISDTAEAKTKERILAEQRKWIAMKDEVRIDSIGTSVDGGTAYPVMECGFIEETTYNRCHILANELAKINGEEYKMPDKPIYGTYVDNQGINIVYSYLVLRESKDNKQNRVSISLYNQGHLEGDFVEKSDGVLEFTANKGDIKGIIKVNGWDGASFEITESDDTMYAVGKKYEFGFTF